MRGRLLAPRKYGLSGCIPAVGEQHRGIVEGGTSDAEGMRRCPRSSKKDRNVSRISAVFIRAVYERQARSRY